jgi:hypothetical protein
MVPSGLILNMLSPAPELLEPPLFASPVEAPLAAAAGASVSGLAEADVPVAAVGNVTGGKVDEPTEVIDMASPPEEILTLTLANRSARIT